MLGLEKEIGSIRTGLQADLLIVAWPQYARSTTMSPTPCLHSNGRPRGKCLGSPCVPHFAQRRLGQPDRLRRGRRSLASAHVECGKQHGDSRVLLHLGDRGSKPSDRPCAPQGTSVRQLGREALVAGGGEESAARAAEERVRLEGGCGGVHHLRAQSRRRPPGLFSRHSSRPLRCAAG